MLKQVVGGLLIHQSELLENNTVVVQGRDGVLLVDAGITGAEMTCLANDLRQLGRPVVAGFSTHPDWDHVLARRTRRSTSLRHSPLRGLHAGCVVERGLEGRRR
ncbi:MBL fold metallo-hydrolase [Streptomyces violaceorubidus]